MSELTIPVSVIIFTLNEEVNLPACLCTLAWCNDVVIVDSFSSDTTEEIARQYEARFFQHAFTGFGDQRNWALENIELYHNWVLILDADERVPPTLVNELGEIARTQKNINKGIAAYRVRRRLYMWGRWLQYASLYPSWVVRFIHKERVRYINRGHAETQKVDGEIADLENDLIDENLKGMDEWFSRQNHYSSKDAEYELQQEGLSWHMTACISAEPLIRRAALKRLACHLPCRPFFYFIYSYLFRRGFLDGKEGLQFCLMKALYQRMIVLKKYELRRSH
jgi:glycosyltransferase involved in cell wall biosynthesis